MPRCDVTVGHYYGQLMTAAHASCHWPAAAQFTEHGSMLDTAHCVEATATVLQTAALK